MTPKETTQFNGMLYALMKISRRYLTPKQLSKGSMRMYGLGYLEALEMSYENIQLEAKNAIKGIKVKP